MVGRSTPSSLWAAALVVGALLLIFAADRATGSTPVQHLYYLPIMLAAVRFRMRGGVISALSAILLYHVANPHLYTLKYEEPDLVQIILFLAVGMITAKMTRDADHLHRLAMTDDLTGLHNLRSFEARLIPMVREARRTHATLSVLVLDLDRLKSLNDQYGHLTGAEAVRTVGRIIGERLPSDAVACRYGGDEFVIAVPRCTEPLAYRVADDLRRAVHASAPELAGRPFAAATLSISVGGICALFDGGGPSRVARPSDVEVGETLFRAADVALYRAKARGRNQVWIEHMDVENGVSDAVGPDARLVSDGSGEAEAAAFSICGACDADAPSRHIAASATRKSPRGNTDMRVAPVLRR
jgi:diguanylate cyclase (GGDEF)-like protein